MAKKIEFTPPAGVVPEGTGSGEEFDLVCTFRVKDSGMVCLTEMGDVEMPGYSEDSEPKGQSDYSDEAKAMQGMMSQGQGEQQ